VNRLRDARRGTAVASIALAAAVTLSLTGCSGDDSPTSKATPGSRSSSSSGASSGALKNESAVILGWTPPAPVAKTEGKLGAHVSLSRAGTVPATAEIISVQASDASTILTWQLSSATDIPSQGLTLNSTNGARFWPDAVRLVDPVGKKSYAVNTMDEGLYTYCVCSGYPIHVGPDPVRMTSAYPALPALATSVSVRIPNFAPVTVPLTR
jgi:hypothetical protein